MGALLGRPRLRTIPVGVMTAFENRFMMTEYEYREGAYTPFYIFVYDLAFFLRNDPAQCEAERCIEKISNHLVATPDDWTGFCIDVVDLLASTGRMTKYGHPHFPILLGITKRTLSGVSL